MSKEIYAVCCYTCEHNGQETCKGCNTILNGENEPYENWQLREDLCQKDKQIAELQKQLETTKIALKRACLRLSSAADVIKGINTCDCCIYGESGKRECLDKNVSCNDGIAIYFSNKFKNEAENELKEKNKYE